MQYVTIYSKLKEDLFRNCYMMNTFSFKQYFQSNNRS